MGYVDNWKEEYRYKSTGELISGAHIGFFSLGGTGTGSRINPINIRAFYSNKKEGLVISSGRFININLELYQFSRIIGQGIDQTFIGLNSSYKSGGPELQDLSITKWTGVKSGSTYIYNSKLMTDCEHPALHIRNSLIFANQSKMGGCMNSSVVGLKKVNVHFFYHYNLFDNCTIELTEADMIGRKDMLLGFNDCTFKIGNIERKLIGETDEEYRADFYKLCVEEAKITPPPIVNGKVLGRWGFANNSAIDGIIVTGSLLDDFQKALGGSIGYKKADVKSIPLAFDPVRPNSLEESTASATLKDGNLVDQTKSFDGMIKLTNIFPLKDRTELKVSSKVINLHGEKKMSEVNILDNLLSGYGINISADHSLSETPVVIDPETSIVKSGELEIGYRYILRGGKDKDGNRSVSSFTYNGKNHDTSLSINNIIPIVEDPNKPGQPLALFTNVVGLPELYKVRSHELYQTLEMRIVDEIDPQKITSGSLASEYWYIVEGEEGGSVTVDNVKYPVDCSFLVRGDVKGVINSVDRAHLKKCFKEDYNRGSDSFYNGKQQPVWFKVVGNDMRCQHLNNSIYDKEMAYDEELKTYVTTGHPQFYYRLKEPDGFRTRAFPIKGRYVQFRLHVSSFNVM